MVHIACCDASQLCTYQCIGAKVPSFFCFFGWFFGREVWFDLLTVSWTYIHTYVIAITVDKLTDDREHARLVVYFVSLQSALYLIQA